MYTIQYDISKLKTEDSEYKNLFYYDSMFLLQTLFVKLYKLLGRTN